MGDTPPDHCLICYAQVSIYHQPDPSLNLPQTLPNLFPEIPPQIFNRKSTDYGQDEVIMSPICGNCSLLFLEVKCALDQMAQVQRRIENFQVKIRDDLLRAYHESCVSRDTHQKESFLLRKDIVQKLDPNSIGTTKDEEVRQRSTPGGHPPHGSKRVRKPTIKQEYYYDESEEPLDPLDDFQPSPDNIPSPPSPSLISPSSFEPPGLQLKPLQIILTRCDQNRPPNNGPKHPKAFKDSIPDLDIGKRHCLLGDIGVDWAKCFTCSKEYCCTNSKKSLKHHMKVKHGILTQYMSKEEFNSYTTYDRAACPKCDRMFYVQVNQEYRREFIDHLFEVHLIQVRTRPGQSGTMIEGSSKLEGEPEGGSQMDTIQEIEEILGISSPISEFTAFPDPNPKKYCHLEDGRAKCELCNMTYASEWAKSSIKKHFVRAHRLQLNVMRADEFAKCFRSQELICPRCGETLEDEEGGKDGKKRLSNHLLAYHLIRVSVVRGGGGEPPQNEDICSESDARRFDEGVQGSRKRKSTPSSSTNTPNDVKRSKSIPPRLPPPPDIAQYCQIGDKSSRCLICYKEYTNTSQGEAKNCMRKHLRGLHQFSFARISKADVRRAISNNCADCPIPDCGISLVADQGGPGIWRLVQDHLFCVHLTLFELRSQGVKPSGKTWDANFEGTCPKCGKVFKGSAAEYRYQRHLKAPHKANGERDQRNKLKCGYCELEFIGQRDLNKHLSVHNDIVQLQFKCLECPRSFASKNLLENHSSKVHGGNNTLFCEKCPASFTSKSSLKAHQRAVHDELFKCTLCPEGAIMRIKGGFRKANVFYVQSNLDDHMVKTHGVGGPLKYHCDKCLYQTNRKGGLRTHMARHENEYNFHCSSCDRKFKTICNLKLHKLQVHSAPRFECEFCGQKFKMVREFNNHVAAKHHQNNTEQCPHCEKSYPVRRYLRNHMRLVHKKEEYERQLLILQGAPKDIIN